MTCLGLRLNDVALTKIDKTDYDDTVLSLSVRRKIRQPT